MKEITILLPNNKSIKVEISNISKIPAIDKFIKIHNSHLDTIEDVKYIFPIVNVTGVHFNDIDIKNINNFIFNYAAGYPSDEKENPAPPHNFKIRHIHNLFEPKISNYFIMLLCDKKLKDQINILLGVMDVANKLKMNILCEKIAAVIALKIKDKPLSTIKKLF